MTSSPNSPTRLRRLVSASLLCLALCLIALIVVPVSSSQATDTNQGAAGAAPPEAAAAGEPAAVAAFRQAVGGSITPLIIELNGDPGVLRKVAADQKGEPLSMQDLFSHSQDLVGQQNAFFARLGDQGVRALLHEKDVTQIDGSVRHIEYRFTYLLNGFIAYVATEDIERLKALPEVAHVSEPETFEYHLDRAVDYSLGTQQNPADRRTAVYGANQEFGPASEPGHFETPRRTKIDGFEGQGMNIAIIDSGVDYRHPMFGGIGQGTPLPRVSGRPETPDDNRKVIYFYAFNEPIGDPTDDFGHGTLVASNAAGYSVDGTTVPRFGYGLGFDGRGVGPSPNGVQLFGTAPQAKILAYKVCGPAPNCIGDIPLSIEDAASPFTLVSSGTTTPTPVAKPVADVINLSLGSASGDPASATSRACNNAALAGVVVVASAANNGGGPNGTVAFGTIGAPASATLAIAVAASLDPGSVAGSDVLAPNQIPLETRAPAAPGPSPVQGARSNALAVNPDERQGLRVFPIAGGGKLPTEENPGEPTLNSGSVSAHYVFVDFKRNAAVAANVPPSVTNRIALVKRDEASDTRPPFGAVSNAIAPFKPAAIVIATSVQSATAVIVAGEIPAFTIGVDDGEYLIDRAITGDPGDGDPNVDVPNGTISELPLRIAETITNAAFQGTMASFSSRGPNRHPNANFRTIKPDVTAPGVSIVGAATVEGIPDETIGLASMTGYTVANGTSFSGPITAGAMVLVRQRVREELGLDTTDLADPNYRAKRFDTVTVARALLQNTATNLRSGVGQPQGDGADSVAKVNDMGAGHINVAGALSAKSIMVAPVLLFTDANPNQAGDQREFTARAGDLPTALVHIPTSNFGPVPVGGLNGTLERRQEVIIRDVTGGQGGGAYNLSVQNSLRIDQPGFQISFTAPDGTTPISSVTVPSGGETSFFVKVVADGRQIPAADPTDFQDFQWYVTAASQAQTLRMPFYYRAVPADPNANRAATLLNISTRLSVQNGDNVLIGGFIVTGNQPKRVMLRGIGPSLNVEGTPVAGRMDDPTLELFDANGKPITSNDDWRGRPERADIEGTGLAPRNDRESAILITLPPGSFTAVLRGKNDSTGIGLVEAFDLNQATNATLANISTRGLVQTGDNVMIGGFIAGPAGFGSTKVLVRAIGPSLAQRGIADALADPILEVFDGNGTLLVVNDDWMSNQREEITATGIPPTDPRESAVVGLVSPGSYTALVRGKDNSTGVALVEVYDVP